VIKVRIENNAEVRKFFEELGVDFDKAVNIAMNDTSDKMATDANQNLSNSIGVNSDLFGSVVSDNNKPFKKYIGTKIEYAPYVEFGTGPQRINKKGKEVGGKQYWPPPLASKRATQYSKNAGEMEKWRKMKGGKFKTHDDLRYAIWKHGTRPQSFMRSSLQKNKRKFPEYLGRALAEMLGVSFQKR
tara:strand:+ start:1096 stop:1653 length:558 start_codon:yes stop_codon:yes gene_type:complete